MMSALPTESLEKILHHLMDTDHSPYDDIEVLSRDEIMVGKPSFSYMTLLGIMARNYKMKREDESTKQMACDVLK